MKRLIVFAAIVFAGCVSSRSVGTSDSPAKEWTPPASVAPPILPASVAPLPAGVTPGATLALPQIIDIALANNPQTRIAWLNAAEARHESGVATIADVLQARTALSQAQLTRETFAGGVRTFEGQIATAMGLPPTTHFEFGELPAEVPSTAVTNAVESLITEAVQQRPDLAATRAEAESAQQRVTEVRSSYLPSLTATSSLGETTGGKRR